LQLIFQDPIASLNPRRRIGDIVAEPLVISGVKDPARRKQLVDEVLSAVGLDPALVVGRLPHEFSGGQCQRICIARARWCSTPNSSSAMSRFSALDVSISRSDPQSPGGNEGALRIDAAVYRARPWRW